VGGIGLDGLDVFVLRGARSKERSAQENRVEWVGGICGAFVGFQSLGLGPFSPACTSR
jgi:hypothetical protein